MKHSFLKGWIMAALCAGACFGFVACDDGDDDGKVPPTPGIESVVGNYAGTMQIVDPQPIDGEGEEAPAATQLEVTVTNAAVKFSEFPVRSLIAKFMGVSEDNETVDNIISAVGPVSYDLPYTATMSADNATVQLALQPEVLKIYLGNPAEGGMPIVVTISATGENVYTLASKGLQFQLTVDQIQLGEGEAAGTPIPANMNLAFNLTKKK